MVKRIGVLALHGDFQAHIKVVEALGHEGVAVKTPKLLDDVNGVIVPGGESTTIAMFLDEYNLKEPLVRMHGEGRGMFGTCAGAILLGRNVDSFPPGLEFVDVDIRRNAYGRQVHSFTRRCELDMIDGGYEGVFIRAPRFEMIGDGVDVLGTCDSEPVMVRSGNVLLCSFHPELTDDHRIHEWFIEEMC